MVSKTRWLDYCLAKPGAWQDEPWEGDVVVKVADKIFAFLGPTGNQTIGLKCGDRETADLLLDRYQGAASKTAYIGKHGWNTFSLDGTMGLNPLTWAPAFREGRAGNSLRPPRD